MASGVRSVIVTMGEGGVLVAEGETATHLPAHQVSVVDTTAAGDAFVGAFAVALAEGRMVREAAAWGNAAGALAITRAGAQPSLPARAELERFLA
jgi:ribokinase